MANHERVLVKHAVTGKMLLNSQVDEISYTFDADGSGFIVKIYNVPSDKAVEVLAFSDEMNLFRFEEPEEGPVVKHWYYVAGGKVSYKEDEALLIIYADSEIEYRPDKFWA